MFFKQDNSSDRAFRAETASPLAAMAFAEESASPGYHLFYWDQAIGEWENWHPE